jgi:hypothetical protein
VGVTTRLVDKVNTWLFYTFTRHVGAWNRCFMSTNTFPKLELLLIIEQSQTWSNVSDSRQHKCRPVLRHTKWINEVIACGPYLPHRAFCEIFHLVMGGWKVEPFVRFFPTQPLFEINRREYNTVILWFLNIRYSGTLFGMWFLTSAHQMFLLILPSKG